jgi:2-dehydropantoate 2-reductase
MRVLVYGAGVLGSLVGGLLSARADVALLGRSHLMETIGGGGLAISGQTQAVTHPITFTDPAGALGLRPELIIVTVKAYDTPRAAKELERHWRGTGILLSLQNGLGNLEALWELAGPGRYILAGTTGMGAYMDEPGHVVYAGAGATRVGEWTDPAGPAGQDGCDGAVQTVVDLFNDVGMATEQVASARDELWRKAIVNASINPVMAVTGHRNGYLLQDKRLMTLSGDLCCEAAGVGRSVGFEMEDVEMLKRLETVIHSTAENKCSMLQDVERGARTEVENINGAIVRAGRARGVAAPLNQAMVALVKGLEPGTFR